jgi:hypothetical protein
VDDLETKNNEAAGQYSMVNAVEWMGQGGRERNRRIRDGLVCLSMKQTRIGVNSSSTSK